MCWLTRLMLFGNSLAPALTSFDEAFLALFLLVLLGLAVLLAAAFFFATFFVPCLLFFGDLAVVFLAAFLKDFFLAIMPSYPDCRSQLVDIGPRGP